MTMDAHYQVLAYKRASDLIEALRLTGGLWGGMSGAWAFRGQACAAWGLLPKAFRRWEESPESEEFYASARRRRLIARCREEASDFGLFFRTADPLGLLVPGGEMIYQSDFERQLDELLQQLAWPPDGLIEALALAQHHGVPTRLVDFSRDPLVALFWAAYHAFHGRPGNDDELAVWAIDLWFVRHAWRNRYYPITAKEYGARLRVVQVPAARNPFLLAQQAFFLLDTEANEDYLEHGRHRAMVEVLVEHASDERTWANLERREGLEAVQRDRPLVRKLILPASEAADLLDLLDRSECIHLAKLMPTYDNVTKTIDLRRELKRRLAGEMQPGALCPGGDGAGVM